jgi:uncharacterized protein (DUF58 family)
LLEVTDILKKVRKLEIKSKRLSNHIFSGQYHTAFKGRGMSFSEVRDYAAGDDVRNIDWNVTARYSHPYVKVFEEERELTVMLLIDCSASTLFGTTEQNKRDVMTELAAVIAFSAISNNDKVGALFFSHKIEKYIPPKKGKAHILFLIRELLTIEPTTAGDTNIELALSYFSSIYKKKSIAFLLSDFISPNYEKALMIANRKHDIVGVHIYDIKDKELPDVGVLKIKDLETGLEQWIDTSVKRNRQIINQRFEQHLNTTKQVFTKTGTELIDINTSEDYIKTLQVFFNNR